MTKKLLVEEFVRKEFVEEVLDLKPDALMFAVRQVKESGKKWHYFYVFDDDAWGADEDVVGAAYTLLNILVDRHAKTLATLAKPNK